MRKFLKVKSLELLRVVHSTKPNTVGGYDSILSTIIWCLGHKKYDDPEDHSWAISTWEGK